MVGKKNEPAYIITQGNFESEKDRAQCIFSIDGQAYILEYEKMSLFLIFLF